MSFCAHGSCVRACRVASWYSLSLLSRRIGRASSLTAMAFQRVVVCGCARAVAHVFRTCVCGHVRTPCSVHVHAGSGEFMLNEVDQDTAPEDMRFDITIDAEGDKAEEKLKVRPRCAALQCTAAACHPPHPVLAWCCAGSHSKAWHQGLACTHRHVC